MKLRRATLAVGWIVAPLVVLAAAPRSPAGEAPAARDAGPDQPPRERPITLEVGWDRGPTYRVGFGVPALERADPTRLTEGVDVEGRVGAELFLDGGWVRADPVEEGWAWDVRRVRLDTQGVIRRWVDTEYRVAFAVDDGKFFVNDFYLRWRPARFADSVRFGYFDPPLSLQALAGSNDRGLAEVAAPVAAFAPGFRLGLDAGGTHASPDLTWAASLTTVGQDRQTEAEASDSALRLNGRLVWRPWHEVEAPDVATLLHVGVAGGYTLSGSGAIRYRARPETLLVDFLVDTGEIEGNALLLALEGAWQRGPVSVQGELFQSRVEVTGAPEARFGGAYLQGSWVLTGEARPYDAAGAVFGRVTPRLPLAPRRGQWGALEALARLSWVDLSDRGVEGGEMLTLSWGLAWTWNDWVRWKAGYTFANVSGGAHDGNVHVLSSRLELNF